MQNQLVTRRMAASYGGIALRIHRTVAPSLCHVHCGVKCWWTGSTLAKALANVATTAELLNILANARQLEMTEKTILHLGDSEVTGSWDVVCDR